MPSPVVTPNMSLTEPGVGVTLSPQWALLMNANMATIDQHNHTAGQGVLIPVAGLDINADLPMAGFNLTMLNSAVFNGAVTGTPAVLSLYSNGTDLFYKDVNGNAIRLTEGGSPASGTGNIQGLPSTPTGDAGILWVNAQSTFQMLQDSGTVGANVDMGTAVLRYPGTYPTPSGINWIALKVPTSIAAGYSLTLPPAVPATADALLKANTSGAASFLSLGAANTVLRVNSGGTALEYHTVDTANITDAAVTTAKIADGAVTQAKLSSVNSNTSFFSSTTVTTTTGDSTSAVTGSSVSLSVSGSRPVAIMIRANLSGTAEGDIGSIALSNNGLNLATGLLTVLIPGGFYYTFEYQAPAGSTDETRWPLDLYIFHPSVSAGTFTTSLQMTLKGAAGGTGSMTVSNGTITVMEL